MYPHFRDKLTLTSYSKTVSNLKEAGSDRADTRSRIFLSTWLNPGLAPQEPAGLGENFRFYVHAQLSNCEK